MSSIYSENSTICDLFSRVSDQSVHAIPNSDSTLLNALQYSLLDTTLARRLFFTLILLTSQEKHIVSFLYCLPCSINMLMPREI